MYTTSHISIMTKNCELILILTFAIFAHYSILKMFNNNDNLFLNTNKKFFTRNFSSSLGLSEYCVENKCKICHNIWYIFLYLIKYIIPD